jgi:Flp pilus assembly pilin Flp
MGLLEKSRSHRCVSIPWGEAGATAVEYAVMVALIAIVVAGSVAALGLATEGSFGELMARWQ